MSYQKVIVKGSGQFELPENRLFAIFGKNAVILDAEQNGPLNGHEIVDSIDTGVNYSNKKKGAKSIIDLLLRNGAKPVSAPA